MNECGHISIKTYFTVLIKEYHKEIPQTKKPPKEAVCNP
jgi:hypothetical protein